MPSHQLKTFLLCFGLVSPQSIFLIPGLVLQRLLATVQARTVQHLSPAKTAGPAGSHLLSSKTRLV